MEFFILVEPWAVYVKEGNFFREQNGPSSKWGERWERVEADSIEHARLIGEGMRQARYKDTGIAKETASLTDTFNRIADRLSLSFTDLRRANLARVIVYKNAKGELSHGSAGINSWSLVQWSNAMAGECGETCNLTKKIDRGDFGEPTKEQLDELGNEIADVIIYADHLAARAGLDLGECVRRKFNIVSDRVGATVKL